MKCPILVEPCNEIFTRIVVVVDLEQWPGALWAWPLPLLQTAAQNPHHTQLIKQNKNYLWFIHKYHKAYQIVFSFDWLRYVTRVGKMICNLWNYKNHMHTTSWICFASRYCFNNSLFSGSNRNANSKSVERNNFKFSMPKHVSIWSIISCTLNFTIQLRN